MSDETVKPLGWWTIPGEALLGAMRRCAAGENPDMVYAELYANASHCKHDGGDRDCEHDDG